VHRIWPLYYRSPVVRHLLVAARWRRVRHRLPHVSHLAFYEEDSALGPLQRDEALLLNALVRVLRPETVVEVGFLRGRSALNFLTAMDPATRLYSFDIDPEAEAAAGEFLGDVPNFKFTLKSQDDIIADDIDGRAIDLLFIDASHDYDLNVRTWTRLHELLAPDALVAVHDTGVWARNHLTPSQKTFIELRNADYWLTDDVYVHQPDERRFVNWIREQHGFAMVQLQSQRTLRHGLTLLQRSAPLPIPDA
jgi:predicted O-methyltransferase YrrM